ncbi:hypothetical protein DSECCO2_605280 [anaerobic digester metagenome]
MLARARLGDDLGLAQALGQQGLAQGVVDLVRAGVGQPFELEIDLAAAKLAGQVLGEVQGRGPAAVVLVQVGQFGRELGVVLEPQVALFKFLQGRNEHLGHVAAAVRAEVAWEHVGNSAHGFPRNMLKARRTLSWSLIPRELSTPELRSKPAAPVVFMASRLCRPKPPARYQG